MMTNEQHAALAQQYWELKEKCKSLETAIKLTGNPVKAALLRSDYRDAREELENIYEQVIAAGNEIPERDAERR